MDSILFAMLAVGALPPHSVALALDVARVGHDLRLFEMQLRKESVGDLALLVGRGEQGRPLDDVVAAPDRHL